MKMEFEPKDDVQSGDGLKTIQWLIDQAEEGDTYIDVGAHIGWIAIPILLAKPMKSILIEPSEYACNLLKKNLDANNIRNYTIINALAGAEVGRGIYHGENDPAHGSIYFGGGDYERDVITIDSLGIKTPIIMKMDCELSEPLVWKGMKNSLTNVKAVNMEFMATKLKEYTETDPQDFIREIEKDGFRVLDFKNNPFAKHELFRDDYKWDICLLK